jgi:hypothetical protein
VIIFDKSGDGQAERNRAVPLFPDNPMRIVTPVSPRPLLALTKEGTTERHPAGMSERLSRSALVAPSVSLMRGRIAPSPREARVTARGPHLPFSNRELDLLERHLSHCKQRNATVSNRELSTVRNFAAPSPALREHIAFLLRKPRIAGHGTRPPTTFLTGSASQTEFVVTRSKQTTAEFLTGARTAISVSQFRAEFRTESQAQSEKECRSRHAAEQSKILLHIRNEKELL